MISLLMAAARYNEQCARENLVRLEIQPDGIKVYGLRAVEGERLPRAANKLVPWITLNMTSFNPIIDALDEVYKELEKCVSDTSSLPELPFSSDMPPAAPRSP
jgi:hypothetical protein